MSRGDLVQPRDRSVFQRTFCLMLLSSSWPLACVTANRWSLCGGNPITSSGGARKERKLRRRDFTEEAGRGRVVLKERRVHAIVGMAESITFDRPPRRLLIAMLMIVGSGSCNRRSQSRHCTRIRYTGWSNCTGTEKGTLSKNTGTSTTITSNDSSQQQTLDSSPKVDHISLLLLPMLAGHRRTLPIQTM